MKTETKDEFEIGYARRSGVTLEYIRSMGGEGRPCACGQPGCLGWAMTFPLGPITYAPSGDGPAEQEAS